MKVPLDCNNTRRRMSNVKLLNILMLPFKSVGLVSGVEQNVYLYSARMHSIDQKWQQIFILMLRKICISSKCCSFELSVLHCILKKLIRVSTKIFNSTTVFRINHNDFWAPNQHISIISEGCTLKTEVITDKESAFSSQNTLLLIENVIFYL